MEKKREYGITAIYIVIYLIAALTIALHQPILDTYPSLCNPPDEHSRYLVPQYICEHGTLPTGFEEELLSGECRWTYGFYTLLPYIIQGYTMRFINLFTDSALALLFTARLVNVFSGLLTALLVIKLSKKLFADTRVRWVFCFIVTFLPQSLFLHTYVNPDSFCLLSTALMMYGIVVGLKEGFHKIACISLTAGIILCALSYYDAYGFIFCSILAFFISFFYIKDNRSGNDFENEDKRRIAFDFKGFIKKGIPIACVVLICISWSFIRNYILYDGDFIGLTTKENFIKSFGIARDSLQDQGCSLIDMLTKTTYIPKTAVSFIANYGSNTMYTFIGVYGYYFLLFCAGIIGMVFINNKKNSTSNEVDVNHVNSKNISCSKSVTGILYGIFILSIIITMILALHYSYTVDYQPQGRYFLPALLPIIFFICCGLEKLPLWQKASEKVKNIEYYVIIAGCVLCLLITVFVYSLPVYLQNPIHF